MTIRTITMRFYVASRIYSVSIISDSLHSLVSTPSAMMCMVRLNRHVVTEVQFSESVTRGTSKKGLCLSKS